MSHTFSRLFINKGGLPVRFALAGSQTSKIRFNFSLRAGESAFKTWVVQGDPDTVILLEWELGDHKARKARLRLSALAAQPVIYAFYDDFHIEKW